MKFDFLKKLRKKYNIFVNIAIFLGQFLDGYNRTESLLSTQLLEEFYYLFIYYYTQK